MPLFKSWKRWYPDRLFGEYRSLRDAGWVLFDKPKDEAPEATKMLYDIIGKVDNKTLCDSCDLGFLPITDKETGDSYVEVILSDIETDAIYFIFRVSKDRIEKDSFETWYSENTSSEELKFGVLTQKQLQSKLDYFNEEEIVTIGSFNKAALLAAFR